MRQSVALKQNELLDLNSLSKKYEKCVKREKAALAVIEERRPVLPLNFNCRTDCLGTSEKENGILFIAVHFN